MSSGQLLPSPGFASSTLDLTEVGADTFWRRMYLSRHPDPLGFGHAASRFSDPRQDRPPAERFGVLYLGASLGVCFLEALLRDQRNGVLGDIPISLTELRQWVCADVQTTAPLRLVDLRGDGAVRMGVPNDVVRASTHRLGQQWALALWSHAAAPDGILYSSRLNEETNLALFNRALPKLTPVAVRPLLDCRAEMADIIRRFRLAIIG